MNIALIALPTQETPIFPPLTVAYIATLLEQRRHIVRIYDLALEPSNAIEDLLVTLRSFRPQLVVAVSEPGHERGPTLEQFRGEQRTQVLEAHMLRSGLDVVQAAPLILNWLDQQRTSEPVRSIPVDVDLLPLPARHL